MLIEMMMGVDVLIGFVIVESGTFVVVDMLAAVAIGFVIVESGTFVVDMLAAVAV